MLLTQNETDGCFKNNRLLTDMDCFHFEATA